MEVNLKFISYSIIDWYFLNHRFQFQIKVKWIMSFFRSRLIENRLSNINEIFTFLRRVNVRFWRVFEFWVWKIEDFLNILGNLLLRIRPSLIWWKFKEKKNLRCNWKGCDPASIGGVWSNLDPKRRGLNYC